MVTHVSQGNRSLSQGLGSLGDFFPNKEIRCRVRGCDNSWHMAADDLLRQLTSQDPELPERMCESCYETYNTLSAQDVPCSRAGCTHTWHWTRYQQLEARVAGHTTPPRRFCAECSHEMAAIADRQMPCRARGCSKTWVWTRQQQMTWDGDRPPTRLCPDCFDKLRSLQDRQEPCKARGCKNTWSWPAFQQLEYHLAGGDLDKPPRRLCHTCFEALQTLHDLELPCKVKECQRTWRFTTFAQLEHRLAAGGEATPPPPERMCPECFRFFQQAQDVARPCRNRRCPNTWTYTRGWQLKDWLKGRTAPPQLMCAACTEKLAQLHERPMPCSVPGCQETWPYTPMDQLHDALAGGREPRPRRCRACDEFLTSHRAETLTCPECGQLIRWSGFEQLLCARGTFVKPTRCSDCAAKDLPTQPPKAPPTLDHHLIVRMPVNGRWNADAAIAGWPPHLDHDSLARAERADIRIVALGDDLTWSTEKKEESWPHLLEEKLNADLADEALAVAVINAGIAGTTSRQAMIRLHRDLTPFTPHLVIVSFILGDSFIEPGGPALRERPPAEDAERAIRDLLTHLRRTRAQILHWTANPAFPYDHAAEKRLPREWADRQALRLSQALTYTAHLCTQRDIPTVDFRSRFEVNGKASAQKWMSDWCRHNAAGARNIAVWMAGHLVAEKLLPGLG